MIAVLRLSTTLGFAIAIVRAGGFAPQPFRHRQGFDPKPRPPMGFLAGLVHLAVMHPAERHGEFVADFQPEPTRLRKAQMMGVGGLPAPY